MSVEQAKAALVSTALYMVPADIKDVDKKLQMAESIYRRLVDIVGLDTPETTVLRRIAGQIERELRDPEEMPQPPESST